MIAFWQRDRVLTHGQLGQRREGALLAGRRMTTAVAGTNTKEVHAFFQMEEAHEIIMKIRGATMGTTFISLLNADLFHLQGGRTTLTEGPGRTRMQDGLWSLAPVRRRRRLLLTTCETRASTQRPDHSQRAEKTH